MMGNRFGDVNHVMVVDESDCGNMSCFFGVNRTLGKENSRSSNVCFLGQGAERHPGVLVQCFSQLPQRAEAAVANKQTAAAAAPW